MKYVALLLFLTACDKELPIWRGKVYVGNSVEGTIERKQDGEVIKAMDPAFGEFLCVRKKSFDCFTETYIVNSKGWKKQSACGLEEEH